MKRISINLNDEELVALIAMANKEKRHPRDQAAYLLRLALLGNDVAALTKRIEALEQANEDRQGEL